jgi:hypothetical protein
MLKDEIKMKKLILKKIKCLRVLSNIEEKTK